MNGKKKKGGKKAEPPPKKRDTRRRDRSQAGKVANVNVRDIPRTLRDVFHSECVKRGVTMKQVLMKCMEDVVRNAGRIKTS